MLMRENHVLEDPRVQLHTEPELKIIAPRAKAGLALCHTHTRAHAETVRRLFYSTNTSWMRLGELNTTGPR